MAIISKEFIEQLNKSATDPASVATGAKTVINDTLTKAILPIAAFVIIMFGIYGAVLYFTAYGSEEKANKGKTTMLWAVVGALVVAAAWLIVNWWYVGIKNKGIL